jgi:DNA polymerase-3 subunit epsilon
MDINLEKINAMTFLDVETPNRDSNSVCEISLVEMIDGKITRKEMERIDPKAKFDGLNISIHGIRPKDVEGCMTFDEFYQSHQDYFDEHHILIGHNIRSDISILQKDLARNDIEFKVPYCIDTQDLVRKFLYHDQAPKGGMALDKVCEAMQIELDAHHSMSDTMACVEIIKAFSDCTLENLQPFIQDATTSKTKERKEKIAAFKNLKKGDKLIHNALGEVTVDAISDTEISFERDGIVMSLRFPVCVLRNVLKLPEKE